VLLRGVISDLAALGGSALYRFLFGHKPAEVSISMKEEREDKAMFTNSIRPSLLIGAVVAAAMTFFASTAWSAGPLKIKECQTITQPGSYVVTGNISASGDCLVIGANNVTIDLAGFLIIGDNTGDGITDEGNLVVGTTIQNGTVSNFAIGINLRSSSATSIDRILSTLNTNTGIVVGEIVLDDSPASLNVVTNSRVVSNGTFTEPPSGSGLVVGGVLSKGIWPI